MRSPQDTSCDPHDTGAVTDGDHSAILLQLLAQMLDAVVIVDETGKIVLFNPAAEILWGHRKSQVMGRSVDMLLSPGDFLDAGNDAPGMLENIRQLVGASREIRILCQDGSLRWVLAAVSRIQVEGRILYASVLRDVTQSRRRREQMRLLSLGIDHTGSAVLIADGGSGKVRYANSAFCRLLGYAPDQALGRTVAELLYRTDTALSSGRNMNALLAAGQSYVTEELLQHRSGRPFWSSTVVNPILDADGQVEYVVGVYNDITDTKMHETLQHSVLDALAHEQPLIDIMSLVCREIERMAPGVRVCILSLGEDGRFHSLAAPALPYAFLQTLDGMRPEENEDAADGLRFHEDALSLDDIRYDSRWAAARQWLEPLGVTGCRWQAIKSHGERMLGALGFFYAHRSEPDAFHLRLAQVATSLCALALEREVERQRIHQLAYYDGLTGLPNRGLLQSYAEKAIARMRRSGEPLAVLFVDLDRLKQVNDTYGHPAGDAYLRVASRALSASVRDSDIVGRLSGDEFVVVLPQCDAAHALLTSQRLLKHLNQAQPVADVSLTPTASLGISLYPEHGRDFATLLRHADVAMYQAKSAGGNGCVLFHADMAVQPVNDGRGLESALREALRSQSLFLHYQPQIDQATGALYGVEALARWHHPQLGMIPPQRFIALAEKTQLIRSLDHWAIRQACWQLAQWRSQGIDVPTVSVNLSASDLHSPELVDVISDALHKHGLRPDSLTLEITEGLLLDGQQHIEETIRRIYKLGVRFSLYDFCTGNTNLGHLQRLPIGQLKLHQSFMRDIERDAQARTLGGIVAHIGRTLDIPVVAEGVERASQRDILRDLGCVAAQGFLFSAPLQADLLGTWEGQRQAAG